MDEQKRLNKLRSYNILDTEKEDHFDRITQLASTIFAMHLSTLFL
jgi:hypothetical protein